MCCTPEAPPQRGNQNQSIRDSIANLTMDGLASTEPQASRHHYRSLRFADPPRTRLP
jgi:hypothetical protein